MTDPLEIERNEPSVPCHFCGKSLYHISNIYVTAEGFGNVCKECASAQDSKYRREQNERLQSIIYGSSFYSSSSMGKIPLKDYISHKETEKQNKIQKRREFISHIFNKIKGLAARVKWI